MPKDVIIITGCSGRLGLNAIERFKGEEYQVFGFDMVPPKNAPQNFEHIKVDLGSDESVKSAFETVRKKAGNRIACIIHLAAYYNFAGGMWELYEKITIGGTERMLTNAKTFEVEQFMFTSTMLVHAPTEPGKKITEDSPLCGSWEYPRSKIITEETIRKLHGNIPYVILRIAGCYNDDCMSVPISNQIQRIYEKQAIGHLYPGDTSHGASFIHLLDVDDFIGELYKKRKELPQELVFLVGEEDTMSYQELQNELGKLIHGKPWKTIHVPKWFAKFGAWAQNTLPFLPRSFVKPWMIDLADNHFELDMSRAKKIVGWSPKRSVRATLSKMVEGLKKDPAAWYKQQGLTMPESMKKG